ncbi:MULTISPECIES: adenosylmethionine decarboxylase [Rhodobacterales]|uniref:adenosylmethionine decarboxylase n=1 Tax=Rhodobacterales TaxID=204455 RepID=UPI003296F584
MHYTPGTHILLDLHDAHHLNEVETIRKVMLDAAHEVGAHVVDQKFHVFGGGAGVTGVVLLRESHISIHTWPESCFAAVDIFLCGGLSADPAIDLMRRVLRAGRVEVTKVTRGQNRDTPAG